MDETRAARTLSPAEAEEIWTGGEDARQSPTGEEPAPFQPSSATPGPDAAGAVLIDMPGVGWIAPGEVSPRRSGRECAAGEVPLDLRSFLGGDCSQPETSAAAPLSEERERLLCQLLFRARQLALKAIRAYRSGGTVILICRECHAVTVEGAVVHARKCLVGGVLSVLDDLAAPQHRDETTEGGAR